MVLLWFADPAALPVSLANQGPTVLQPWKSNISHVHWRTNAKLSIPDVTVITFVVAILGVSFLVFYVLGGVGCRRCGAPSS